MSPLKLLFFGPVSCIVFLLALWLFSTTFIQVNIDNYTVFLDKATVSQIESDYNAYYIQEWKDANCSRFIEGCREKVVEMCWCLSGFNIGNYFIIWSGYPPINEPTIQTRNSVQCDRWVCGNQVPNIANFHSHPHHSKIYPSTDVDQNDIKALEKEGYPFGFVGGSNTADDSCRIEHNCNLDGLNIYTKNTNFNLNLNLFKD